MFSGWKFDFKNYKNLDFWERKAVAEFIKYNSKDLLVEIIQHYDMSPDMRRFVADIVTGKLKRPQKKVSTDRRDRLMVARIGLLIDSGHKLTSNRTEEGAAAIVADKFGVLEDVALKAYTKANKILKDSEGEKTLLQISMENDNSHIP